MFSFYIFQFFICWKCNPRCVRLSVGRSVSVLIFSRAGEVTLPSSYRSICFHKWSYELQYIYLSLQHKQILDTWQTKYLFQLYEQTNLLYSFISLSLSLSLSLSHPSLSLSLSPLSLSFSFLCQSIYVPILPTLYLAIYMLILLIFYFWIQGWEGADNQQIV